MQYSMRTLSLPMVIGLILGLSACDSHYDPSLPESSKLGNPRGFRIVRTISHFHSPYSWDACDKKGLNGTTPNPLCLKHLRDALCTNQVDHIFLTDHPDGMQNFEIRDLLLAEGGDQVLLKNGLPYANRMSGCSNSFTPQIMVGFEDQLLALGMSNHLDSDPVKRGTLYRLETHDLRVQLASQADALVVIPHTESRSLDTIKTLQPDAIEIYNFHANIDPKIRVNHLHVPPFKNIPGFLSYLVDPYHELNSDFAFLNFLETFPAYFQTWDALVGGGLRVAGWGGSDSHENVFPQNASDGERLDSHRRVMRVMSNHLLVYSKDPDEIKQAMKSGRGWTVFEGFGSPVGMDFYANVGSATYGVGQVGSLGGGGSGIIHVKAPSLHESSPRGSEAPRIRVVLKQVFSDGSEKTVASSEGGDIQYSANRTGIFRAEVLIVPRHLRQLLGAFSDQADKEFTWIIANHLYLDP